MSSFGTFLTNRPYRRYDGRVQFHQRFIRQSNRYCPKVIRPKFNLIADSDPLLQNQMNQQKVNYKVMDHKTCSEIVPTIGMSNLIFYQNESCAEMSMEEISSTPLMPSTATSSSSYLHRSQFVVSEVLLGSTGRSNRNHLDTTPSETANKSQDWMNYNFDAFVRPRKMLNECSFQDFTLSSNTRSRSFYSSLELALNGLTNENIFNNMQFPNIASFEDLSFDMDLHSNINENQGNDSFEMSLKLQNNFTLSSDKETRDSIGFSEFCSGDESMEKFNVSSCGEMSLDLSCDESISYANFVPTLTSTPKPKRKKDVQRTNRNGNGTKFFDTSDEHSFLNQRIQSEQAWFSINDPTFNFTLPGRSDDEQNRYFF